MAESSQTHECDLFLLSSHQRYYADRILSEFARRGERNFHGWGIGSYINGNAKVIRTDEPAFNHNLSREFSVAISAVSSPIILGHLRLTSRGSIHPENNHPFKLHFLNYDWLLIHNGSAYKHDSLIPFDERLLLESDNDSARIFEFLRQRIISYYLSGHKRSLIEGCRSAYTDLLNADPNGSFNVMLTNGYISFVFIHWRPFYLLNREKDAGDTALLSTIKLTENEDWIEINPQPRKKARMLVFSGPTLIYNGGIPK